MKNNKQILIFLSISYGIPALLSVFMWITRQRGLDCSVFPITWMLLPAAAVMVAKICTETRDRVFPKTFYLTYIIATVWMILLSIASSFIESGLWAILANVLIIICGIVCFIEIVAMGKEKRKAVGLSFRDGIRQTGPGVLLFVMLYALIFALTAVLSVWIKGAGWNEYTRTISFNPFGAILLIVNLPLSYLVFFGEEYGWRYFFQPALQKKYGLRKGVILLGVLWGIWHLPLNFLYYSPETGLFSLLRQIAACIGMGIFFGWIYMRTGNIWSVVLVHFLQNNIGAFLFAASPTGVVLDLKDVLIAIIVYMSVYLPFLNKKEYKYTERLKTNFVR